MLSTLSTTLHNGAKHGVDTPLSYMSQYGNRNGAARRSSQEFIGRVVKSGI